MGKCKIFLVETKQNLVNKGILKKDGTILNNTLFNIENSAFKEDFKKLYGVDSEGGIGTVKDNKVSLNTKAASIENNLRKKAAERYEGVDLDNMIATLSETSEVKLPRFFATKLATDSLILDPKNLNKSDTFVHFKEDLSIEEHVSLDKLEKQYPNSGLANLIKDLKNKNLSLLAGLSLSEKKTLDSYIERGKRFENNLESEGITASKESLDNLVDEVSSESSNLSNMNNLFNEVLKKTKTEFSIDFSNNKNKSVVGETDTSKITLSPANIGMKHSNAKEELAKVYMHEKAHVITIGLLNMDPEYKQAMLSLYEKAKELGVNTEAYGMTNVVEFIAEALTNEAFQDDLRAVQYSSSSMWSKLIKILSDAFKRAVGFDLEHNLLGEIMAVNFRAMKGIENSPLNGPMSAVVNYLETVEFNGNYIGNGDLSEVYKAAEKIGLRFINGQGFFYTNENGEDIKVPKDNIPVYASTKWAEFTNNLLYGSNDYFKIKEQGYTPFYKIEQGPDSEITSIFDLKERRGLITTPANSDSGMYEMFSKKYFRTTSYLGFGVTEKPEEGDYNLFNAEKIGNFTDEVGKRIFDEAYGEEDINYSDINAFIKAEAWERYLKNLDDFSEDPMSKEEWDKEYKDPISYIAFENLVEDLLRVKQEITNKFDVKQFHSDIIVWDEEKRIAGEIDVLAELEDGRLMVIDIKTRKKGLVGYGTKSRGFFSDKRKHTMQTNSYSNMLEKMGFKTVAPLIIMSKPSYTKEEKVDNVDFDAIDDNGSVVTTIRLDKVKDEESAIFDFTDGTSSNKDPLLKSKNADARKKYKNFWFKEQIKEGVFEEIFTLDVETATEDLKSKVLDIRNKLQQFKSYSKKATGRVQLTTDLEALLNALNSIDEGALDKLTMNQMILIASNYFNFAADKLLDLKTELSASIGGIEEKKDILVATTEYRGVFTTATKLYQALEEFSNNISANNKEFDEMSDNFKKFAAIDSALSTDINIFRKQIFKHILTSSYLGSKGEIKMRDKLRKEAEKNIDQLRRDHYADSSEAISDKELIQNYINTERSKDSYREKVLEHSRKEVSELVNKPANDMMGASFLMNSDVTINNEFVQLIHRMLMHAEQKFSTTANEELIKLSKLSSELNLSKAEQKELVEVDIDGNHFLLSDYKIEFSDEITKRKKTIRELSDQINLTESLPEKIKLVKKLKEAEVEYKEWFKNNTKGVTELLPIDKWKTDYSKLNDRQLKALDAFKKIQDKNESRIIWKSLIKGVPRLNIGYYRLPGVIKTVYGHLTEGNLVATVKKQWDEMTKIEVGDAEGEGLIGTKVGDELEDGEVFRTNTRSDGKPIQEVPVYFRGYPKDKQNLDLFTVYGMELQNGIRYEIDNALVIDANIILDTVNSLDFVETAGFNEKVMSNFKGKDSKGNKSNIPATIKGDASVVSKQLNKMFESRVYSITQVYGGKKFGKDINRLAATIGSYTTFASMSFKVLGATNNWITGTIAATLEATGSEFYTAKDLANAKAFYYKNIGSTLADINAPVQSGIVNQLMAIFDTEGGRDILGNEFERKNILTRLAKPGTSLAGYASGEHEIHATIMLAVLESQKVLNKKGQYLNKEGKVVKFRKDAASLLDAFQKNENNIVELAEWAKYSEFDTQVPLKDNKEGYPGLASIRALIKDRVARTQGDFDKRLQGQLNRLWWGKLLLQFKKHMAPQLLNRFRGVFNAGKSTNELDDSKKYFNYNSKTEEYGYYTTFFRMIIRTLKEERLNLAGYIRNGKNQWSDMSKHERANTIKTLNELSYIITTFILSAMAVSAADDDDDLLWGLAYLLRRQTTEGGLQYLNPAENWRTLDSPMAAYGKINDLINTTTQLFSPFEEYSSGRNAGENKLYIKTKKALILDRFDQFEEGYNKRMYGYISK